jgi:hypothetical protein
MEPAGYASLTGNLLDFDASVVDSSSCVLMIS